MRPVEDPLSLPVDITELVFSDPEAASEESEIVSETDSPFVLVLEGGVAKLRLEEVALGFETEDAAWDTDA